MSFKIISFNKNLLPQAAELLTQRQRAARNVRPELPARFEDTSVVQQAIEATLARPQAVGLAAVQDGTLIAYLIGEPVIDPVWGRSGWVRLPGCAYDAAAGPEPIRDLYAVLGEQWVNAGIYFHFALIPATNTELNQTWFSLSFGLEQIHAILDLQELKPKTPIIPSNLTIRQAIPEDRPHLAEMSDVIWRVQVKAPVWGVMLPEKVEANEVGWAELAADSEIAIWLAFQEDEIVGIQGYWPASTNDDDLITPVHCIKLSVAGTRSSARGQGIGTLLTQSALAHAWQAGYHTCQIDWRSTNLLADRFWLRQGFQPIVHRLVRRVDSRISWASGKLAS